MIRILYMNVNMLKDADLCEKGMKMVSSERKEKISQMKNPVPARLSLGAGILLKIALEEKGYAHLMEDICYSKNGKPFLKDVFFYFNLSHSGEYAVCAYGDQPIGIDLQIIKEVLPKHTGKILTEDETEYLTSLNEKDKVHTFYSIWAKKESLIKLDGRGLRIPLHNISMVNHIEDAGELRFEDKEIYVKELDFLWPEYASAVSSENEIKLENVIEITSDFLINY